MRDRLKVTDVRGHEPPHGNHAIWRYTGLEKFLGLLTTKRLFLSPASSMSDELDGTIPARSLAIMRERMISEGKDEEAVESEVERLEPRSSTLLNCWSIKREESYALWKIYLGGSSYGVAIRSTIGRLRKALTAELPDRVEEVWLGRVSYTDFLDPDSIDPLRIVLRKSEFYDFEDELRVVAMVPPGRRGKALRGGYGLRIDPNVLIEKLYMSPFSSPWFRDTLESLLDLLAPELRDRIYMSEIRDH